MGENTSHSWAGVVRLAESFVSAAELVAGEEDAGAVKVLFPFLFLIGHGLELAYKAILLANGATEKDLKQIGHNLGRCRQEVQFRCPGLLAKLEETGTKEIVAVVGPYYKAKALEYHKTGLYRSLPDDPNQVLTITAGTVKNMSKWLRRGQCLEDS